jgi:hypothetical protein
MKQEAGGGPSGEHERVYHAVSQRQVASLRLTLCHLHDLKKACSGEGQRTPCRVVCKESG